jgi:deoxycytidylate deaminase
MEIPSFDVNYGRHTRYIRLAQKLAEKSDYINYRMSCVVVKGGRVIAVGINKLKSGIVKHPSYGSKAIHAELDAILTIDPEKLKGATVYVGGITKTGGLLKSAPCPICQSLLREYGIRCVVFHEKTGEIRSYKVS